MTARVAGRVVPDPQRCTATARSGERCRQWAVRGTGVCRYHGGLAPQAKAKAKRRLAAQRAEADARAVLAFEGITSIDDPFEELGRLAAEVVAMKDALGHRVNALRDIRYSAPGAGTEQIRGELQLLGQAQDRAGKFLDMLVRSGFEERRVRVIEHTDQVLTEFMRRVGLDGDQSAEDAMLKVLSDQGGRSYTDLHERRGTRVNQKTANLVTGAIDWLLDGLGLDSGHPWVRAQMYAVLTDLTQGTDLRGRPTPALSWWQELRKQANAMLAEDDARREAERARQAAEQARQRPVLELEANPSRPGMDVLEGVVVSGPFFQGGDS